MVLAAGAGRRFGRPDGGGATKLLARWRGRPLIEPVLTTVARAIETLGMGAGVVVVPPDDREISDLAREHGFTPAVAESANLGIAESLRTGLHELERQAGATAGLIVLGDQPLLTLPAIQAVVSAAEQLPTALVRARYRGAPEKPGHPVLVGREHWGLAAQTTGDRGLDPVVRIRGLAWTEVWVDGDSPDIDTQADLDRLPTE